MDEKDLNNFQLATRDYDSAFECDSEVERKRAKRSDLAASQIAHPEAHGSVSRQFFSEECSKEEGRNQRFHLLSLDAYSRHKMLINQYLLCFPGSTDILKRNTTSDRTEHDVLKENHKFLWTEDDTTETWGKRLAKKYYDKLFKEYCLSDLSRYRENKIAMRWRTEQELVSGKGQFICGSKSCKETVGLRSWEVNFAYDEDGERKNALVKLRLCFDCSFKLNYRHQRKELKSQKVVKSKETVDQEKRDETAKIGPEEDAQKETVETRSEPENENVWKEPVKLGDEKTQEDEFEEYLADMLL